MKKTLGSKVDFKIDKFQTIFESILEKDGDGTLITVTIQLELDFKTKIFSPIIKKWYKSMLTGIFYKMNTEIINSEN